MAHRPIASPHQIYHVLGNTAAVAAVCMLVAACALVKKENVHPCPTVFILDDAKQLVRFKRGPGRDVTDILFEAEFVNFRGSCRYKQVEDKWTAEIDLAVQIAVRRRTATHNRRITFKYFAALPGFQSDVGGKSVFSVIGTFKGPQRRRLYEDEIKILLPLRAPAEGAKQKIVLGLQLSRAELGYNRLRHAP